MHCRHVGVFGGHMIGIFCHLGRQVYVGTSEVSHWHSSIRCWLCNISERFLYSDQVGVSVAALAWGLLPLSGVWLCLDEVCLEGRPGFFILFPTRHTVFGVLSRICYKSLGDTNKLCFWYWLARGHCEVGALVEPLNEAFKGLRRVVRWPDSLVIVRLFRGGDAGVVGVHMQYQLQRLIRGVPCVRIFYCGEVGVVKGSGKMVLQYRVERSALILLPPFLLVFS